MSKESFSIDEIKATVRKQDAWWQALVVDPIAIRLTWLLINYTSITPNQVTLLSFCVNVSAAWMFANNSLVFGGGLFFCAFLLDCVDGKIARAKSLNGKLGQFVDVIADMFGHLIVICGLVYGQIKLHGIDECFVLLVIAYIGGKYILTYQYLFEKELLGGGAKLQSESKINVGRIAKFMSKYRMSIAPGSIDMDAIAFVIFPIFGAPLYGIMIATVGFLFLSMLRIMLTYRILLRNKNSGL